MTQNQAERLIAAIRALDTSILIATFMLVISITFHSCSGAFHR